MIRFMTGLPQVRSLCYTYLPWLIASPLISVWCFLLDGVFIGATRTREMRDMMLVSTFLVFIPAWFIFQFLGNHGLWLAFMMFFAARAGTLLVTAVRINRGTGFIKAGI